MHPTTWLAALLFVGSLLPSAQDQAHSIRVEVQTVSVDVEVFDGAGRPVTDLGRGDFQIYEDGKLQEVRNFSSVETPYSLVFLFDCSDSTEAQWPLINQAVAQFSKHKRPQDRVLLASFASQVHILQGWDSPEMPTFSRNARGCMGTRFYAALNWAAEALRPLKTRRGVVVLTDGVDSSPAAIEERDFYRTLAAFRGIGIPIYVVAVGTDVNPSIAVPGNPPEVRLRLEQLAETSGGHAVFPKRPEDVIPMYERIGRELGTSYSLGYAPPNPIPDGKRHSIEVRLRSGKLRLRQSRDAYVWK